jgi:hypothetical protein
MLSPIAPSVPRTSPYTRISLLVQAQSGLAYGQTALGDSFERVAHVAIRPTESMAYIIPGEINVNGDIVQPGLWGRQYLGHLDTQGNYKLVNGLQGNYYKDPYLQIIPALLGELISEQENPLATNLKAAERQRAINGSEIPLIRVNLTAKGIDGRGIKVGILDSLNKDKQGRWLPDSHSQVVAKIINDPVWGVAPRAQIVDAGAPDTEIPESTSDNLLAYQAYLVNQTCHSLSYITGQVYKAIQRRDPQLKVLNITKVTWISGDYQNVLRHLQTKDKYGYYKYPLLRTAILGHSRYGTPKQQLIACQQFIDKTMSESPILKQAQQQYVEATRQAAKAGIITVVGAGNWHIEAPYDIPLTPGAGFSLESRSPYVISVAASNTNQTPGNRLDDVPARFSSRGDGYLWNPTIAAPGQEMGISAPIGEIGHNLVVSGTSFSTPYVCGVIAMMLQRNPFLSFDQVKAKLQATAVKNPHYSVAEIGAGFLNTEAAVLA